MAEMTLSDEDHRDARFVAGVDRKLIADTPARLNDRRDSRFDALLHTVGEGKESVGSHYGAFRFLACVLYRLLSRPDAIGLSHADARRPVLFADDDGV